MASRVSSFARRILDWYGANARSLPWRARARPYEVWVSEVMLQQTRVDTVVPYFARWMRRFPTVDSLAASSEPVVLRVWEGLGYYTRARNLRLAAQTVMQDFNGELPPDVASLLSLPGIGPYTAGAISSIAFGRDEPVLDANIRRVLSRAFNLVRGADSEAGKKELLRFAAMHMPRGRAGDFNQALMDLGAVLCVPKKPRCSLCPVRALCVARRLGVQEGRPRLATRKAIPHRFLAAAVIRRRDSVLVARRPSKGLLGGMWEFPNVTVPAATPRSRPRLRRSSGLLLQRYGLGVLPQGLLGVVRHAYSHFRVTVQAFECALSSRRHIRGLQWVRIEKLHTIPMGRVDRQIAELLRT